jgi:hypothetical protein
MRKPVADEPPTPPVKHTKGVVMKVNGPSAGCEQQMLALVRASTQLPLVSYNQGQTTRERKSQWE